MSVSLLTAPILIAPSADFDTLAQALQDRGFPIHRWHGQQSPSTDSSLLLTDARYLSDYQHYQSETPDALLLGYRVASPATHLDLPDDLALLPSLKIIEQSYRHAITLRKNRQLQQELQREQGVRQDLTAIGIALAAENQLDSLLRLILTEAGKLACCDAGSLFLIDHQASQPELVFKLAFNDSVDYPFEEQRFALNLNSLAGYVALTGQELNLQDVYQLPANQPFKFNAEFDLASGYRSQSMLILPMKDHQGTVLGVLQFVNCKQNQNPLYQQGRACQPCRPFDADTTALLRCLAGQSAVAINNSQLLNSIQQLFEGFVSASVKAIEQRDPVTSGHSFRVANLTTALAEAVNRTDQGPLKSIQFNAAELRELRYAALLHDFGKVGVREEILQKPRKLSSSSLERIRYKIALQRERIEKHYYQQLANAKLDSGQLPRIWQQMQTEIGRLDKYLDAVLRANEPSVLPEGEFEHLREIHQYQIQDFEGSASSLLSQQEFLALSVRQGSLTLEERLIIQSHVLHTFNFLRCIPWTGELKKVPLIAAAHHEKLDGSGYPFGLQAEQIPFESRMMTVADIFDALTAADRPYKKAMPLERALDILQQEVKAGQLDPLAVGLFIDAKVYLAATSSK